MDYQLVRRLCTSTGSSVYSARALHDGRPLVLKLLATPETSPGRVATFKSEYELMRSLDVPGLARPGGLVDGAAGLAMLLAEPEGEALDTVLGRGRLDPRDALQLTLRLVDMLEGLHLAGIAVLDLRPANLLVPSWRSAYLTDLTLAATSLHQAASLHGGIPDWSCAAPEQVGQAGMPVDGRADFYALGVMLFRMLTGRPPFLALDPAGWAHCHLAQLPPAPVSLVPGLPVAISNIVLKLLAKLPEDRYQSAHGLRLDLLRCLGHLGHGEPVPEFSLGEEDCASRVQLPQRLYGREAEQIILTAALDHMMAAGQRRLVMLDGRAGSGKSRLAHALRQPVESRGGFFVDGKCGQYLQDSPFGAIFDAFGGLVRRILTRSNAELGAWRERMLEALGDSGQLILDVLPQVEFIIGAQPEVPPLPLLESQRRFMRVFREFVRVFAREQHPLVIFLDDLQWADADTISLLDCLLGGGEQCWLLVVVAYRGDEVAPAHPLPGFVEAAAGRAIDIQTLRLDPLPLPPLSALVADALRNPVEHCAPLARAIYAKTGGNPLFFTRFLEALAPMGLLRRPPGSHRWAWDLDGIAACNVGDDVVGLLGHRLAALDTQTRQALHFAAVLGNAFDIHHLSLVCGVERERMARTLSGAAERGLIALFEETGRFLHDRIQQAAYTLGASASIAASHLRVGRVLRANLGDAATAATLYETANHYNRAASLLDADDRAWVAALNLEAGRRARRSAAPASACAYLGAGVRLLTEDDWRTRPELCRELHLQHAECLLLTGAGGAAEAVIGTLRERCRSARELALATILQIQLYTMRAQYGDAVACALPCLERLGIVFSAHPDPGAVRRECDAVLALHAAAAPDWHHGLAKVSDRDIDVAMQVLAVLSIPASFADTALGQLVICRIVAMTMRHGVSQYSAQGLGCFACVVGPISGRFREGRDYARIALEVAQRHGYRSEFTQCHTTLGLTAFWVEPVEQALYWFRKALETVHDTENSAFSCFARATVVDLLLQKGIPLDQAWDESSSHLDAVRRAGYMEAAGQIACQRRLIAALRGQVATEPDLLGRPERATTPQLYDAHRVGELQHAFLLGRAEQALAAAADLESDPPLELGQPYALTWRCHAVLAIARCWDDIAPDEREPWRLRMVMHAARLQEWSAACAPAFKGKHALAAAEIARIEQRDADALRRYQEAVDIADGTGYLNDQAIAHEAIGRFFLSRGMHVASQAHLAQARRGFLAWGAHAKAALLEAEFAQLERTRLDAPATPTFTPQLDLLGVIKASQAISGCIVLDDLVVTLMRVALESAGAQSAALLLVRDGRLVLVADTEACAAGGQASVRRHQRELPPHPQMLPLSLLNYVHRTGEPVVLPDAAHDPIFAGDEYLMRHQPCAVLCMPVMRRDTLLGVLYLENRLALNAFGPERLAALQLIAAQTAISFEHALLYADLQERAGRIRSLVESNLIGVAFWHKEGSLYDANEAFLRMTGYTREELVTGMMHWSGLFPPSQFDSYLHSVTTVLRHGSSRHETEIVRKGGERMPVLLGSALFGDGGDRVLSFLLDLSEQKRAEGEIRRLALYDRLTGLPNRNLLEDRLGQLIEHAGKTHTRVAVMFIDLDRFKHVNDALGHEAGDRMLRIVGESLQQCVSGEDSLGRYGGDEFVLCLPVEQAQQAAHAAEQALELLCREIEISGHTFQLGASMGISMYPEDGTDVGSLLRAADRAMYLAKEHGRGRYAFFTPELTTAMRKRLEVSGRLRHAMLHDEFEMHYQPQVDLETGRIHSVEALLRWRQPDGSLISAGPCIPVAEETGLILDIGAWVLHQACRQLAAWREEGLTDVRIAVNLSPRQFLQDDLDTYVEDLLAAYDLPGCALELEITEGVLLQQSGRSIALLQRFHELGIHLALDDFGTGYSSLGYLQRFPVQTIKIDQSFVRGIEREPGDEALVTAIIAMARGLGLKVVAEGVETAQQVRFLLQRGCAGAQGHHFWRPMAAAELAQLLRRQAPAMIRTGARSGPARPTALQSSGRSRRGSRSGTA